VSDQLSVWGIISHASLPVQFIMVVLLILSIISWAIIFKRNRDLKNAQQQSQSFETSFWSGIDLNQLYTQLSQKSSALDVGLTQVFQAGFREFMRLRQTSGVNGDSVMEGTQRAMRVALSRELGSLEKQLPFLATVASVSPYIGLLGTVWGIMSSFISLAQQNQVTLQVVAPDIAEALIATAMGLVAAIPAVIAYNRFTSQVDGIYAGYSVFAEELTSILHRRAHATSSAA
jgi:biopolymer transport protein TolQ